MHLPSQIITQELSYRTDNKNIINQLSLNLTMKKIGLVGRNGIGKSTLLKLFVGELKPTSGNIKVVGTIGFCEQILNVAPSICVSEFLGIHEKLQAQQRIANGIGLPNDYEILQDNWRFENDAKAMLDSFALSHLSWQQAFLSLSGGEQTKLQLAKIFLSKKDILILDEPTNNLDMNTQNLLLKQICESQKQFVIVSHDRKLLNEMEQIIEMTSKGVKVYGGNYDFYQEQKDLHENAIQIELNDAKKNLFDVKKSIQRSYEIREQKQSKGRKLFISGKIDRLSANAKWGKSEQTQSRLATQAESMLKNAQLQLEEVKTRIDFHNNLKIKLPKTKVPNGKMILEITNMTFSYEDTIPPIIQKLNLNITGPKRIGIVGKNGTGKSTLIQLILGLRQPRQGNIQLGTNNVCYVAQHCSNLQIDKSILQNFLIKNPAATINEAHYALAQFLFKADAALQTVNTLSGGEKIRAELACALLSATPPLLLILDEPTNHLDLGSLVELENVLKAYEGALLVVSHDEIFLRNIGLDQILESPFGKS